MSLNLITYFEESGCRSTEAISLDLKRHFVRVASQSSNGNHVIVEARRHPRHRLDEAAMAVRLNDLNEPIGPPFQIFVMDVSIGGVGFIHTRAFPTGRLAIKLSGLSVVMIGQIVRCVCRNRAYEIGMEFIERAGTLPNRNHSREEEFDPYGATYSED